MTQGLPTELDHTSFIRWDEDSPSYDCWIDRCQVWCLSIKLGISAGR